MTSETVGLVAVPLLALFAWFHRDRGWKGHLTVIGAALAGILVVALCPGNAQRLEVAQAEGRLPGPHDLAGFLGALAGHAGTVLGQGDWTALAPLLVLAVLLPPPRPVLRAEWVAAVAGGLLLVALAPMTWTGMLVGRALNPMWLGLVVAAGLIAWDLGRRSAAWVLVLLAATLVHLAWTGTSPVLIVGAWLVAGGVAWLCRWSPSRILTGAAIALVLVTPRWWRAAGDAVVRGPVYAVAQIERLDLFVAAAPGSVVGVPRLAEPLPRTLHREDLHFTAESWQNRGVARFFGLASVHARLSRETVVVPVGADQRSGSAP